MVVDRVVYEVEEGDVMAVFPGQLHAIYGFEDQRMDYENIIFSLSLLMGAEGDLCTERFLLPLAREQVREPLFKRRGMEGYEAFAGCIQALDCVSEERGTGYQLAVKGQLYTFLYLAFQSGLTMWENGPDGPGSGLSRCWDTLRSITERSLISARPPGCAFTASLIL